MNKADVINKIAEDAGVTKKKATIAVDSFIEGIKNSLASGSKAGIAGFGTFSVKTRKARVGRNPRTGETLNIPERKVATFKPSPDLKKAIL